MATTTLKYDNGLKFYHGTPSWGPTSNMREVTDYFWLGGGSNGEPLTYRSKISFTISTNSKITLNLAFDGSPALSQFMCGLSQKNIDVIGNICDSGYGFNDEHLESHIIEFKKPLSSTAGSSVSLAFNTELTPGTYYIYLMCASWSAVQSLYYAKGSVTNTTITVTETTTNPTKPTTWTISKTTPKKNESITLSWSGAAAGVNNAITGYEIYSGTSSSSMSLLYTAGSSASSYTYTNTQTRGGTRYFKIRTKGTVSGTYQYSGFTSTVSYTVANTAPATPTVSVSGRIFYKDSLKANSPITVTNIASSDADGETLTYYYSTTSGGTKTSISKGGVIKTNSSTLYFYAKDKDTYSAAKQVSIETNIKPDLSISPNFVSYDSRGTTHKLTNKVSATFTDKNKKTFKAYEWKIGNTVLGTASSLPWTALSTGLGGTKANLTLTVTDDIGEEFTSDPVESEFYIMNNDVAPTIIDIYGKDNDNKTRICASANEENIGIRPINKVLYINSSFNNGDKTYLPKLKALNVYQKTDSGVKKVFSSLLEGNEESWENIISIDPPKDTKLKYYIELIDAADRIFTSNESEKEFERKTSDIINITATPGIDKARLHPIQSLINGSDYGEYNIACQPFTHVYYDENGDALQNTYCFYGEVKSMNPVLYSQVGYSDEKTSGEIFTTKFNVNDDLFAKLNESDDLEEFKEYDLTLYVSVRNAFGEEGNRAIVVFNNEGNKESTIKLYTKEAPSFNSNEALNLTRQYCYNSNTFVESTREGITHVGDAFIFNASQGNSPHLEYGLGEGHKFVEISDDRKQEEGRALKYKLESKTSSSGWVDLNVNYKPGEQIKLLVEKIWEEYFKQSAEELFSFRWTVYNNGGSKEYVSDSNYYLCRKQQPQFKVTEVSGANNENGSNYNIKEVSISISDFGGENNDFSNFKTDAGRYGVKIEVIKIDGEDPQSVLKELYISEEGGVANLKNTISINCNSLSISNSSFKRAIVKVTFSLETNNAAGVEDFDFNNNINTTNSVEYILYNEGPTVSYRYHNLGINRLTTDLDSLLEVEGYENRQNIVFHTQNSNQANPIFAYINLGGETVELFNFVIDGGTWD